MALSSTWRSRVTLIAAAVGCAAPAVLAVGCGCTGIGYEDGLTAHGTLSIPQSEPANLLVDGCRNGVCGRLAIQSPPDDAENALLTSASGSTLNWHCSLQRDSPTNTGGGPPVYDGYWSITVVFESGDEAGAIADGDVVFVKVTDVETGRVLIEHGQEVDYSLVGNGDWCPSRYSVATIELSNG